MSENTGRQVEVRDVPRTATELKAEGKDLAKFPTTPHLWALVLEKRCKHLHGKFGEMAAAKVEKDPDGEQITRSEGEPVVLAELEKSRANHDAMVAAEAARQAIIDRRPEADLEQVTCACGYIFQPMTWVATVEDRKTGELKVITRKTDNGQEARRNGVHRIEGELVLPTCAKCAQAIGTAFMDSLYKEAQSIEDPAEKKEFIAEGKRLFHKMNGRTYDDAHAVVAAIKRVEEERVAKTQTRSATAEKITNQLLGTLRKSPGRGMRDLNRRR